MTQQQFCTNHIYESVVTFHKDIFSGIQFIITSKPKQINYYFKKSLFPTN